MPTLAESVKKYRDYRSITPNAPVYMREFGYFGLENWISQGHIKDYGELHRICGFDENAVYSLGSLGWCEAAFMPCFDTVVLEDRGEYELVQDYAGRGVLYYKNRRNGFMPEYVTHPVADFRSWEENCKWRLQPTPERIAGVEQAAKAAAADIAKTNRWCCQGVIGGYMYLRSLIGPLELPYMFYDNPELIHDCMKTWFELSDAVIAAHQKYVTFDELFLAEDICYNVSSLLSPDMMREFLFPYYEQLIANMKRRQAGAPQMQIQIDTDGFADCVIDVYRSIGMDAMSPFEVASGCDVVRTGQKYPDLVILGGIDKRVLAQGREAIDRMLEYIMPAMYKRGGYIPTCDHGVPEEVSFENYVYFRQKLLEYAK